MTLVAWALSRFASSAPNSNSPARLAGALEGGTDFLAVERHPATVAFEGLAGQREDGMGQNRVSHVVSCFEATLQDTTSSVLQTD
jgi:hypothetical protein